jgi:hypothetical protein
MPVEHESDIKLLTTVLCRPTRQAIDPFVERNFMEKILPWGKKKHHLILVQHV